MAVAFELAQQPQLREPPVPLHRICRYAQGIRRLFHGHPAEARSSARTSTVGAGDTSMDPGRLLLTGQPADLGVMESTQLRGISRTAPYFHNNSAATLDEVLDLYDAFFRRSARLFPPPNRPPILSSDGTVIDRGFVTAEERPALLAYLRKL